MKYTVDYLDLVVIRSCNLSCQGCCTFSDHREINGLVSPLFAEPALKFFSQYIEPKRLHIFGGEPLMHPKLFEWISLARKYWPTTVGSDGRKFPTPIWINTNGYYLEKIFNHIDELFIDNHTSISVTHHTTDEPYSSLVLNNYKILQDLILDRYQERYKEKKFQWIPMPQWDSPFKKFIGLTSDNNIYCLLNMTMQNNDKFVPHYKNRGVELLPWHEYDSSVGLYENHKVCHIKNYVQIYDNKLWKCPPRAVLNHTLETYNLQNNDIWKKYYSDYVPLEISADPYTVDAWFAQQKLPEKTCNMCGFMNSDVYFKAQQHLPKKK